MWEERIRRGVLSFLFVSLSLPIAFQQTALGLLLAFLAYWGWRQKGFSLTPLDLPLLGVFVAFLLATLFSPAVLSSLAAYRKLWLVGAFWGVYHLVSGPREAWRLLSLFMIVAVVVAVYGIVQHFTGLDLSKQLTGKASNLSFLWNDESGTFRTKAFFPSTITYAHNLLFPLTLLTAWLFVAGLTWRERLLLLVGWSLMVLALLFSVNRGVGMAYVVVLAGLAFKKGKRSFVAVSICLTLLGLLFLGSDARIRARYSLLFDLQNNISRIEIWRANFDMIQERPFLGWGYGNHKRFRDRYYAQHPEGETQSHSHNNFLQMWVDGGVLGLGAFLYLGWVMVRSGWRAYRLLPSTAEPLRTMALGGTFSIVGFFIGGLTQYNFGDAEVVIVLWAMVGLVMRMPEWARAHESGAAPV
jgi:O-antigen ligase